MTNITLTIIFLSIVKSALLAAAVIGLLVGIVSIALLFGRAEQQYFDDTENFYHE
jgi:hypothetical protein